MKISLSMIFLLISFSTFSNTGREIEAFPSELNKYFNLHNQLPIYKFTNEEFSIDGDFFEKGIYNNDHHFYSLTNFKVKFTEKGFDLSIKIKDEYISDYFKFFNKNLAYSENILKCEIKDSQIIYVDDYNENYGSGGPGIGYWQDVIYYFQTFEISEDNFLENDDYLSLPFDCPDLFLAKLNNTNLENFMEYKNGLFFLGVSWNNRNSAYKWLNPKDFSLPSKFIMFLNRK